jgi:hypothetical protein
VPPGLAELLRMALAQGKEVIDKDADVSKSVARRDQSDEWMTENGQSAPERRVKYVSFRWRDVGQPPRVVDKVGSGFGAGAEEGSRFDKSHREGEAKTNERFRLAKMGQDDEDELGKVLKAEPDVHICIG